MALGLTYVTGVLSLLFAGALLDQYLTRRQPHHLLWFVAFAVFTMAIGVWFIRETFGLNQWLFRLWYLGAAMLAPAYLGTGMLYLMAPPPGGERLHGLPGRGYRSRGGYGAQRPSEDP